MFISSDREKLRQTFYDVWNKACQQQVLQPLEQQIKAVIDWHPEYHFIFENPEKYLAKDYFPELDETNPFLHMSMHLGVQEQAATNRPKGYQVLYQRVVRNLSSHHEAEHLLMEVLAEGLHQSQRQSRQISDTDYLKRVKKALKQHGIKN